MLTTQFYRNSKKLLLMVCLVQALPGCQDSSMERKTVRIPADDPAAGDADAEKNPGGDDGTPTPGEPTDEPTPVVTESPTNPNVPTEPTAGPTPPPLPPKPTMTPTPPSTPTPTPTPPPGTHVPLKDISPYIVVDQFGYLPSSEKIAVIRDPQQGFDAAEWFYPGSTYQLINATTGQSVHKGTPQAWNNGEVSSQTGDKVWWYDFSSVTAPGSYYVLDDAKKARSDIFEISGSVYRKVLVQSVRSFFYQRAGIAKEAKFAGIGWADGASHMGPLQDKNCRRYNAINDASTERDLRGGWYDAGDYNRYTSWTAIVAIGLMQAYHAAPHVFWDDYGIPESGNGVADILDEVKWGMDFLVRMQNADGSVLSIVGVDQASPPSSAKGQSKYGPANTSGTLYTAAAFAYGAKIYGAQSKPELKAYAGDLLNRAKRAYAWAEANPNVVFKNNDSSNGSGGLGAGQQEVDDFGRFMAKMNAAVYLYDMTRETKYRDFVEAGYGSVPFMGSSDVNPFQQDDHELLLYFSGLPNVAAAVKDKIRATYRTKMNTSNNFNAHINNSDQYLAFLGAYSWASNKAKSAQGLMFALHKEHQIDSSKDALADKAAQRYLHYIHGLNPLSLVYLSNMYNYGAYKSVNEFYHSWFTNGSALWDRVGVSKYGPPPGFLTGGPNPYFKVASCCPASCGNDYSNKMCTSESVTPPAGQPPQKAYKDFNTSWPLNSWEVSENSTGYQIRYIKLLARYIQ